AAAATSAFMIGVTGTAGAVIYYGHGQLNASFAAAAVLGGQLGSWGGMRFGARASAKWLKLLMATVLFVISVLMLARGARLARSRMLRGASSPAVQGLKTPSITWSSPSSRLSA